MVSGRESKVTRLRSPEYIENQDLHFKIYKKRRRGLIRRLTVFFILVALMASAIVPVIQSQHDKVAHKKKVKDMVEQKLADLKKEGKQLKGEKDRLNDPQYIGKIARRDDFMSKDGEFIFTTPSDDSN